MPTYTVIVSVRKRKCPTSGECMVFFFGNFSVNYGALSVIMEGFCLMNANDQLAIHLRNQSTNTKWSLKEEEKECAH